MPRGWTRLRWCVLAALAASAAAGAQQAPMFNPEGARTDAATRRQAALDTLAYRPDVNGVANVQAQLANAPETSAAAKAAGAALRVQAATANAAGRTGEAMRLLYQAITAEQGGDWTAAEFGDSLVLDPTALVADRGQRVYLTLRGAWPTAVPAGTLSVHFRVVEDKPGGATVADLGTEQARSSDYVATPARFALQIMRVPVGHYRLVADVSAGSRPIAQLMSPIDFVDNLHATTTDVIRRLGRIQGHDAAKATIRYPFNLAKEMNLRQREAPGFDFKANIARSLALLAQLEAGHDTIERATGDVRRARFDTETEAVVPYRLYVPTSWDGKAHLPMVVFLHGANLDENNALERNDGALAKLAEARHIIVVSPLGYRMNSAYGAALPRGDGGFGMIADPDARRQSLSEADVIAVTDIVASEYDVDRRRVYLMGNSMGGMGTWYLGAKYAARWAAISPAAGGVNSPDFDWSRLKGMPIRAVAGELDMARMAVEASVRAAKEHGVAVNYVEVPGGTHGTAVEMALPATLDFFAAHPKRGDR